jgi:hypothetical protein
MNRREKTEKEGRTGEAGFAFPFGDCQSMFEKMRECCGDMSDIFDCCFMMRKMKEEKVGKSEGK